MSSTATDRSPPSPHGKSNDSSPSSSRQKYTRRFRNSEAGRELEPFRNSPQGAAADRLAAHYIPDKVATETKEYGSEARRQSRLVVGWGAAAGRRGSPHLAAAQGDFDSLVFKDIPLTPADPLGAGDVNDADESMPAASLKTVRLPRRTSSMSKRHHHRGQQKPLSQQGPSSQDQSPQDQSPQNQSPQQQQAPLPWPPLSRTFGTVKSGAGREAWGKDRGGHDRLGARGYESDDALMSDDDILVKSRLRTRTYSHSKLRYEVRDAEQPDASIGASPVKREEVRATSMWKLLKMLIQRRHRWNNFKWCLVVANTVLTAYAIAGLIATLLAWANFYTFSTILFLVNRKEIILCTTAASLCLFCCLIGWVGILLNNRAFLSWYTFLLWLALAMAVSPAYMAYKRRTFNLAGKMNHLWSRELDLDERRLIQVVLQCCGYYSPFIEAASDGERCYGRSTLPGCKAPLVDMQRQLLLNIYAVTFALVAPHLGVIVIALLCSNHVTFRFGKGRTPKAYRLDADVLREAFEKQLAETADDSMVRTREEKSPRQPFAQPWNE